YFDTVDKTCKTFVDGGCNEGGNNYGSKVECEQHCLFSINSSCPIGSFPLTDSRGFPFSCLTDKCPKGFKCHFASAIAYCCTDLESNGIAAPLKSNQSICNLKKDRGPCNEFKLRFYYDREEKDCKYFFYGGCDGNKNNFATLQQCAETVPHRGIRSLALKLFEVNNCDYDYHFIERKRNDEHCRR
ncbi:unnamed protein product, partial [Soboliphyme baturini]|uniref:BPTI/Kunitz inhibitor domain-containing protein n=1 Tax=Soboliphyme baturini TaxID=241478 RepID=A0A183IRT6_9BILA